MVGPSMARDNPLDRFRFWQEDVPSSDGANLATSFHEAFLSVSTFQPFQRRMDHPRLNKMKRLGI
jgi:hypothetical protein